MIGRVLAGRYKVVATVGEGGMSRVWRAQDLNTGKAVAVKVLREEYRDDETFIRRFEREALAASRMTHPNIANLLDVGLEEDGTRYLVIEYVSGKTLKQFVQESGALKPDLAAQIIMRVLAAVQHAHQNGVIHRDIKPQNILIDKDGAVKVSDFGIARVANSQTMNQDEETVMGSVYYFSPEQAKGAVVDEKSDLYSVGVVFYEMLTGTVPFTGDAPVAIAMKHLQEAPVPPSEVNPAVSSALDYVVLQALEKRPRNRYVSAADMLRDVRLAMEHPDTILAARAEMERRAREQRMEQRRKQKAQKRTRWMRRALVGVFSLLLLGAIAVAGYMITERMLLARQEEFEMPNAIGKDKAVAYSELVALGLEVDYVAEFFPLVPENVVANQSIPPGTRVRVGAQVTLTICVSEFDMTTPNVVGMPIDKAQKTGIELGMVIGDGDVVYVIDNALQDRVIAQDPPAGTPVNRGDSLKLTVSAGRISMPKLIGLTQNEAENTAMLRTLPISDTQQEVTEDPQQVGKVLAQTPPAFADVRPGSPVQLTIGVASENLIEAEITIDLATLPAGGTLRVTVLETNGDESQRYLRTFDEGGGQAAVYLYSETERAATYRVYFNDALKFENTVTFIR